MDDAPAAAWTGWVPRRTSSTAWGDSGSDGSDRHANAVASSPRDNEVVNRCLVSFGGGATASAAASARADTLSEAQLSMLMWYFDFDHTRCAAISLETEHFKIRGQRTVN